jgi:hypothetical protein
MRDLSKDPRMDQLEEILRKLDPDRVQQLLDLLDKGDIETFKELQNKGERGNE